MTILNKKDVIQALERIAVYLEIKGENPFKISAYRKAAQALERDERTMAEIEDPSKLTGIGKGTAGVIEEFVTHGETSLLTELAEEIPDGLLPLLKLPGLGGKKIGKLYQELDVVDVHSLRTVCEENKVRALAGFGAKSEEKILASIEEFGKRPERLSIAQVRPAAEDLIARLNNINEIERFELAGSFRRGRETVKDLDIILSTEDPKTVGDILVSMEHIYEVVGHGETKVSVELQYDDLIVPVDFRMVRDESFATILHHFTGSKDHNVLLRQRAKERGEKISEYGVENEETGEVRHFETEEAFFNHFDLAFIPPEVREGMEELEAFEGVHSLVEHSDIKSDLHMHTTWSDGAQSIEEMVNVCKEKGYTHMAITDHSKYLMVANGLSVERLKRQHEEVKKLNEKEKDITIFTGIEMDILPDGSLDYTDDVLKEVDFVIASIHSSFQQDEDTIMKRLENACRNPHVAMIAHPTGRVIGKRAGYPVNMEKLFELAVETDTILELNANPNRLDLSSEWVKKAQAAGVKIAVNTDAHRFDMLDDMPIGVKTARRGWLAKDHVVNTWSAEKLKEFIDKHR
ncbi:DNA polymerase/3'-5' exonuclease PolX [Salipaludibacillus neizhouensis]|uniref:DNA-directed DNA polymerase n=1 Tax=Salipaludibacillus neizhouensis TaxID=885475 RepID=A0A3A9K0U0_9BACI|nr:DNA polymerase/3'-5' exonuclease PolX [Salipaludibacillus neizhouensis]RKL65999.1 DNA polymerase/3'-5' exonuclease PolX [Salipaludibacillus neizhouensis]